MTASIIPLFALLMRCVANAEDYVHSPIQYHSQNSHGSYNYGYDTGLYGSHQFHQEHKDDSGRVIGRYGYTDPYGKLRLVNYISGPEGYQVISDTEDDKRLVSDSITNIVEAVPQISKIGYSSPSKVILSKRVPPQPAIISQEPQLFEEQVIIPHEPIPSKVIIPQQPFPVKSLIPPPPVKALKTHPKAIIPQYPIEEQVHIHQERIPLTEVNIQPKVFIPQPIEQQRVLHEEPVPVKTIIPLPAPVKAIIRPPLVVPQQPIEQIRIHHEPVPLEQLVIPPQPIEQQVVLHEEPAPVKALIPPPPVKAIVKPLPLPPKPIEQQFLYELPPPPVKAVIPPPAPVKAIVRPPLIIPPQPIEQQRILHEEQIPFLPAPQPVKTVINHPLVIPQQPIEEQVIIHQNPIPVKTVIPAPIKAIVEPKVFIPQQPIVEQLRIHQQPIPVKSPNVVIPQQVIEEQVHIHQEPLPIKEIVYSPPVKSPVLIPSALPPKVFVQQNQIIASVKRPLYHYRSNENVKRYMAGIDYATNTVIKAPPAPIIPGIIPSRSIQSPIQRFRSAALIARSVNPEVV